MKKIISAFVAVIIALAAAAPSFGVPSCLVNVTKYHGASALKANKDKIITVKLRGKINHFGNPDFHAVVPDVLVWAAEFPESKKTMVRTDKSGWWTMDVLKYKGVDLEISFIYEKEGWITTKSNVITVTDEDNTDLAIQFIDPDVYNKFMKPLTERMMKTFLPPGSETKLKNAVVGTVGKRWASMHDDRLPHGDPGASVNAIPGGIGPIYFDKSVKPNPSQRLTSVDGGVAWVNVPPGTHVLTATKEGVEYKPIKFIVGADDAENGITLYIASPPDSIQGSNESGPGQD